MIIDILLTRKNNFLSLFRNIRVKSHQGYIFNGMPTGRFLINLQCVCLNNSNYLWPTNGLASEKTDVSSVKSLRLESNPLIKSFMCTKKNNRPKIDPWRTPALMGDHSGNWSSGTTLWCLFLRNEFITR